MNGRTCLDCPSPISRCSTGRCRVCALALLNSNPEFSARRTAGIRLKYKDETYKRKRDAALHAAHMAARNDPEKRERMNRNIWTARARLTDPDVRAKFLAGRAAAGAKRSRTVMAWCPESHLEQYRHLTRSKRLSAAEARRVIEESFTPFDRQMQRIRQGAGIVTVRPMPSKSYAYTLGGVAEQAI